MQPASSSSRQSDLRVRLAALADVEPLAHLINAAFRVQQPFIDGDRTDPEGVRTYMEEGKFLLAEDSAGLAGCIYVELRGDRGYLGLLGVDPPRQGTGLGRKLMDAAENYFRHLGYVETGTAPFAPDVPLKVPCHYICMSKSLV